MRWVAKSFVFEQSVTIMIQCVQVIDYMSCPSDVDTAQCVLLEQT